MDILEYVLGLFSKEELDTAKPIQNTCPMCKEQCGNIFIMNECKNMQICGNCLDDMYDSYQQGETKKELFKCFCCDKKINSYLVK